MAILFNKVVTRAPITITLVLLLSVPCRLLGAESVTFGDWQINADKIIEYKELGGIVATGDVNLIQLGNEPKRIAESDWLSYDTQKQTIKLRGNIFLHGTPKAESNPPVQDIVYISEVGSDKALALVQKPGYRSYQQSRNWLVSFTGVNQSTAPDQIQKESITQKPHPIVQKPLVGAKTFSTGEWDISSDQMYHMKSPKSFVATGNVVLRKKRSNSQEEAALLYCDWLSYDASQKSFKLRGNVQISDEKIVADSIYDKVVIVERDFVEKAVSENYIVSNRVDNWLIAYEKGSYSSGTMVKRPTRTFSQPITISQPPLQGIDTFSSDEWDIAADEIITLAEPKSIIATDNVILRKRRTSSIQDAAQLQADWLSYDLERKSIRIRGNITIDDDLAENESVTYDEIVIEQRDYAEKVFKSEYASRNTVDNWLVAYKKSGRKATPASSSSAISTEEWDIAADRVIRYEEPNSVIAVGNVVLTKRERIAEKQIKIDSSSQWDELLGTQTGKPQTTIAEAQEQARIPDFKTTTIIYADWIAYDVDLGIIKAKGNVRIDNGDENLYAKEGDVDINSETGVFENATLTQTNKLHLEGKRIEKTGYDTYHITDGWVITCKVEEGEEPPWSISSAETDVRQDGFAVLKHARFNVKGVPIFYTPYMVLPVKNTRQTGFLFPEISISGDSGFGLNVPFFWDISESTDLTLYPQFFSERGFMPGIQFRYVLDAESKGIFDASYLSDNINTNDADYDYDHTNSERYWIRGKADHTFGNGWVARADIDIVSDKDYLNEFDSGTTGFSDTEDRYLETFGRGFSNKKEDQRESTVNVMKSWQNSYLEMGLLAVNDVRIDANGNDIETDKPFWKLPEVIYSGAIPMNVMPVTFDWISAYANFWREDGYGGHRIDLYPSISANLPISELLETSVDFGIRNTYYSLENYGNPDASDEWIGDSSENRFLYDFEFEVATTLERSFYPSGSQDNYLEHTIRPFVRYNFLSDENQANNPFFDSKDRIDEENGITFGFDSYLFSYDTDKNGNSKSRQYAYFELEQTVNLSDITMYDSNGNSYEYDEILSNLSAKIRWYPWERTYLQYKTKYNYYGDGFISHSLTGSYTTQHSTMGLEYSFNDYNNIEELNGFLKYKINQEWSFEFDFEHSLYNDETQEANLGITYTQPCWAVTFGAEIEPDDITFSIMFELANIGIPFGGSM